MSDPAIDIQKLGKMYKLYPRLQDKVLDAFGINSLLFWRKDYYREFWALRDVSLNIARGERIGIIGRNGAGKSTLLKIITGNIAPTEGSLFVKGTIQALMEIGTGFHPEFTGRQNIHASLSYIGIPSSKLPAYEEDIIDFTELADFIDQPVKTYSSGMYARLAFATSTVIEPDILIVDEILGVGDAYFVSKCVERIGSLTRSGTTLLLVSHSMSQILQFCDKAIWVDRGRIAQMGQSMEVVKAYDRYTQVLENKRLMSRNLKFNNPKFNSNELDKYSDHFLFRICLQGAETDAVDVRSINLWKGGEVVDKLALGAPQDANHLGHSSYLPLSSSDVWSPPCEEEGNYFRSLEADNGSEAYGTAIFHLFLYEPEACYEVETLYRIKGAGAARLELHDGAQFVAVMDLADSGGEWSSSRSILPQRPETEVKGNQADSWPGTNEILIKRLLLLASDGRETALLKVGEPVTVAIEYECQKTGNYPVLFCVVFYRLDGIRVSCHLSEPGEFHMTAGQRGTVSLHLTSLNMGNGNYFISTALYRNLEREGVGRSEFYDLIDRNFEFQVFGNEPINASIFNHPDEWIIP